MKALKEIKSCQQFHNCYLNVVRWEIFIALEIYVIVDFGTTSFQLEQEEENSDFQTENPEFQTEYSK